jgi:hypothetical protein
VKVVEHDMWLWRRRVHGAGYIIKKTNLVNLGLGLGRRQVMHILSDCTTNFSHILIARKIDFKLAQFFILLLYFS